MYKAYLGDLRPEGLGGYYYILRLSLTLRLRTATYDDVLRRTTMYYYGILRRTTPYYGILRRTTTYYDVVRRRLR